MNLCFIRAHLWLEKSGFARNFVRALVFFLGTVIFAL